MVIIVGESDEKGPKRLHLVKLVNKGHNYDPFAKYFNIILDFKKHDFRTMLIFCTNILATHEIVHDRTIRYFSWFRTLIYFYPYSFFILF